MGIFARHRAAVVTYSPTMLKCRRCVAIFKIERVYMLSLMLFYQKGLPIFSGRIYVLCSLSRVIGSGSIAPRSCRVV